ncbi:MAG TPA: lipopolysaccharide kinase InaA family protein, partial [Methylophilaceae bacterium]|nr:lipopolysaccharide kinase InaA family protein [Methylophilaceae bacterium]
SGLATFSLALSGGYDFECEEIVRCVPGKRLVCRGKLDGQSVHAKLFIGRQDKRHAARDLRGVRALADAGIPVPSVLFVGAMADGMGEALIFITVPDSVNAEQALHGLGEQSDRAALAKKLVVEVARHHQAGLIQTDLYLKNFLLQGEQIYTLDGDAIRKLPAFFSRHRALSNLALLLSKFDVGDEAAWLPGLLDDYAKARGWNAAPDMAAMNKCVAAHRRGMVGHYADEKVFRQCSDIEVEKDFDYFLAVARPYFSESLRFALSDPDKLLDAPAQRIKSGNTCTVSLAEVDGRKVVVKRYNIKSFWHGLNRALRPTRAAVSWANAHRLLMYGIATAAPIALL